MSTRALYTFTDNDASFNVYKHSDGYPTGAAAVLRTAFALFAWPRPRFEADEAAAAFVAAGKVASLLRVATDEAWEITNVTLDTDYIPGGQYARYRGGGVRLMPQGEPKRVAAEHCSDIEYRYEVFQGNDEALRVRAYTVDYWPDPTKGSKEELIIDCRLDEFTAKAVQYEKEDA